MSKEIQETVRSRWKIDNYSCKLYAHILNGDVHRLSVVMCWLSFVSSTFLWLCALALFSLTLISGLLQRSGLPLF